MEIASWLGPYTGGTEYDEGRPYISAIDGPGGPIITADHETRARTLLAAHRAAHELLIIIIYRTSGLLVPRGVPNVKWR